MEAGILLLHDGGVALDFTLEFIDIEENCLLLTISAQAVDNILAECLKVIVMDQNDKMIALQLPETFNDVEKRMIFFELRCNIRNIEYLTFLYSEREQIKPIEQFNIGKFFPISCILKNSYCSIDRYIVSFSKNKLMFRAWNILSAVKYEISFLSEILSKSKKAFLVRAFRDFLMTFSNKKNIWLISDRILKADDNGEALFRFMQKKRDPRIKCIFLISKSSQDYSSLKKIGPVVEYYSIRHRLLLLMNSIIISSHADEHVINPFGNNVVFYKDIMYHNKFVFLQHGITKDDLSEWLNKFNKNISIFITATVKEYESILFNDYYYNADTVKLTGFPRYDYLYKNEKRYVTIMPTWRKYLNQPECEKDGRWKLSGEFIKSEYRNFYNQLLNSKRLLNALSAYNYSLCFMPHPIVMPYVREVFDISPKLIVFEASKPYRELFAESNLIITDYSSVAFDFAYLRKPVIYTHFDREEFFSGSHMYRKGYFDYERDGFGEVEYTLEGTISRVIDYIENGCELKQEYQERVNSTFAFNDQKNCERVYNIINELNAVE